MKYIFLALNDTKTSPHSFITHCAHSMRYTCIIQYHESVFQLNVSHKKINYDYLCAGSHIELFSGVNTKFGPVRTQREIGRIFGVFGALVLLCRRAFVYGSHGRYTVFEVEF